MALRSLITEAGISVDEKSHLQERKEAIEVLLYGEKALKCFMIHALLHRNYNLLSPILSRNQLKKFAMKTKTLKNLLIVYKMMLRSFRIQ
jgi:hypothetical protein